MGWTSIASSSWVQPGIWLSFWRVWNKAVPPLLLFPSAVSVTRRQPQPGSRRASFRRQVKGQYCDARSQCLRHSPRCISLRRQFIGSYTGERLAVFKELKRSSADFCFLGLTLNLKQGSHFLPSHWTLFYVIVMTYPYFFLVVDFSLDNCCLFFSAFFLPTCLPSFLSLTNSNPVVFSHASGSQHIPQWSLTQFWKAASESIHFDCFHN